MKHNPTKNRSKKSGLTAALCCAITLPAMAVAANAYADDAMAQPSTSPAIVPPAAQTLSSPAQVSQAQPANKRRADQGGFVDAAARRRDARYVVAHALAQGLETARVRLDVLVVVLRGRRSGARARDGDFLRHDARNLARICAPSAPKNVHR